MGAALDRIHTDFLKGDLWHSGDPLLMEHFRNAYVRRKGSQRLVRKEYPNSERKIDSVVGAALAYEARSNALALPPPPEKKGLTRVRGRAAGY